MTTSKRGRPAGVKYTPKVTRDQFRAKAKTIALATDGLTIRLEPCENASGTVGWKANARIHIPVGGQMVLTDVVFVATVVGSKTMPGDN